MLFFTLSIMFGTPINRTVALIEDGHVVAAGALLSPVRVLTAAHAVSAETKIGCAGALIPAARIVKEPAFDLAIVELAAPCDDAEVSPLASEDPEEGSQVVIQGFPGGGARRTLWGHVANYEEIIFFPFVRHVMVVDARISGGSSGGPVMNRFGHLVGIVSAKQCMSENIPGKPAPTCYGIVIPVSSVDAFLIEFAAKGT